MHNNILLSELHINNKNALVTDNLGNIWSRNVCDYRQGLDWWVNLLTIYMS
jgi:hypothetical protein